MTERVIVALRAVDWGMYGDQTSDKTEFKIVWANVVGFLVSEDEEKIVLAPQWFDEGDTRCTLVIPKVCISERRDIEMARAIVKPITLEDIYANNRR